MNQLTQNRIFSMLVLLAVVAGMFAVYDFRAGGDVTSPLASKGFIAFFVFAVAAFVVSLAPVRAKTLPAVEPPPPGLGMGAIESRNEMLYRESTRSDPRPTVPEPAPPPAPPAPIPAVASPELEPSFAARVFARANGVAEAKPATAAALPEEERRDADYWQRMFESERRRLQKLWALYQEGKAAPQDGAKPVEVVPTAEDIEGLVQKLQAIEQRARLAGAPAVPPPLTPDPAEPAPGNASEARDPAPKGEGGNGVEADPLDGAAAPSERRFAARTIELRLRKDLV